MNSLTEHRIFFIKIKTLPSYGALNMTYFRHYLDDARTGILSWKSSNRNRVRYKLHHGATGTSTVVYLFQWEGEKARVVIKKNARRWEPSDVMESISFKVTDHLNVERNFGKFRYDDWPVVLLVAGKSTWILFADFINWENKKKSVYRCK